MTEQILGLNVEHGADEKSDIEYLYSELWKTKSCEELEKISDSLKQMNASFVKKYQMSNELIAETSRLAPGKVWESNYSTVSSYINYLQMIKRTFSVEQTWLQSKQVTYNQSVTESLDLIISSLKFLQNDFLHLPSAILNKNVNLYAEKMIFAFAQVRDATLSRSSTAPAIAKLVARKIRNLAGTEQEGFFMTTSINF